MKTKMMALMMLAGLVCLGVVPAMAQQQDKPVVALPQPGVPEIYTIEGTFVRAAYNNEGYVILGYETSNRSVGEDWMLLDVGMTMMARMPDYTLRREAVSLSTPDGATLPLPSIDEHRQANTAALQNRARAQRDSINYFPPGATRACGIVFFPDLTSRELPRDDIELSPTRACLGRLFFKIPGGITHGQYFLNVTFEKSVVRVPFRILTEDEEKLLDDNYKDIRKQVQDAFRPKK